MERGGAAVPERGLGGVAAASAAGAEEASAAREALAGAVAADRPEDA